MKSNNKTDNLFIFIKTGLAQELEKAGSSLDELEAKLAETDLSQGKIKLAAGGILGGIAGKFLDLGTGLLVKAPELAATLALGLGSAGGVAAYGLNRHLDKQDKDIQSKRDEMDRVKSITQQLKSDYNIE